VIELGQLGGLLNRLKVGPGLQLGDPQLGGETGGPLIRGEGGGGGGGGGGVVTPGQGSQGKLKRCICRNKSLE